LKRLVYINLFFAIAAVSCKALLKSFLNGTCIHGRPQREAGGNTRSSSRLKAQPTT